MHTQVSAARARQEGWAFHMRLSAHHRRRLTVAATLTGGSAALSADVAHRLSLGRADQQDRRPSPRLMSRPSCLSRQPRLLSHTRGRRMPRQGPRPSHKSYRATDRRLPDQSCFQSLGSTSHGLRCACRALDWTIKETRPSAPRPRDRASRDHCVLLALRPEMNWIVLKRNPVEANVKLPVPQPSQSLRMSTCSCR